VSAASVTLTSVRPTVLMTESSRLRSNPQYVYAHSPSVGSVEPTISLRIVLHVGDNPRELRMKESQGCLAAQVASGEAHAGRVPSWRRGYGVSDSGRIYRFFFVPGMNERAAVYASDSGQTAAKEALGSQSPSCNPKLTSVRHRFSMEGQERLRVGLGLVKPP